MMIHGEKNQDEIDCDACDRDNPRIVCGDGNSPDGLTIQTKMP